MCPHSAHRRRCSHQPFDAKHSTQPDPLGLAFGLIPSISELMASFFPSCKVFALAVVFGWPGKRAIASLEFVRKN
jgi:hypothetical protein